MKLNKIKNIFLDILSFGTPQAIVFNLTSILLILRIIPTSSLEYSPIKCVFKHFLLPLIFGGNCPTSGFFAGCEGPVCGLTRAMSRLLHGDLVGAWSFNKMVFIIFFVIVLVIIINLIKSLKYYKKTGKILSSS